MRDRSISRLLTPLLAIAVLLGLGGTAQAASVFSLNLLGERLESGDVRSISLGSSSQLVMDSLAVLQQNPAMLARISRVTIGATQLVAFDEGRSDEFSERDVSAPFSAFRIAFPIAGWFVFSVGFSGRYDPDGSFSETGATPSGQAFTRTFIRSGGLFAVPFNLSFALSKYAAVGLTVSMERGFIEDREDVVFEDESFAPGTGLKHEDFSGTGFGGGIALFPFDGVVIGGAWESEVDYDTDVQERFTQVSANTSYKSSAVLPARASIAATWEFRKLLLIAGSYGWSDFKNFEGLAFPTERLREETSFSLGVEYLPGVALLGRRIPLRASVTRQQLPFQHPIGQDVNKFLIGLGTTLGVRSGRGRVDIGFQVGSIGGIDDNGIEDRVFRMYIGVSGAEIWKRKGVRDF